MKPFYLKLATLFLFTLCQNTFSQSTILWHRSYDSGNSDEGKHISVNSQGSVYIAGLSTFGPSQNVLSMKYDSTGTLVFAYKCNPELPGPLVKLERAISTNIFALSAVPLSGGDMAYCVSKYTSSGTFKFQFNSGDSLSYRFTPVDLAVDNAENIVVAGTFENYISNSHSGFFIKQLSVNGSDKWTRVYSGTGLTQLYDLCLDNSNNIYVCGAQGLGPNSGDFVIQKYNANGVLQWTKTYNGSSNLLDRAEKIVVENTSGNVYVAGTANYSSGNNQVNNVLVKYNSSGVRQWQKTYGHTGVNTTKEIVFDASLNAYVIGDAIDNSNASGVQPSRIFYTKFTAGGTQQWLKVHNNGNYIHEYCKSAVSDNSGNLFIAGEVKDSASFVSDMLAFKLNSSGNKRWEQRGDGAAGENDFVTAITKDANNNIYITGRNGNASYDARTTRIADKIVSCSAGYTQMCYLFKTRCFANADVSTYLAKGATIGPCVGLKEADLENEASKHVSIYPNPSNSGFRLILPAETKADIEIYDLTGREVVSIKEIDNDQRFGQDLLQGIYLAKIKHQGEIRIVKLIKSN